MSYQWANPDSFEYVNDETGYTYRVEELSEEDILTILPYWTKEKALSHVKRDIEDYAGDQLVDATFFWTEKNHNFYVDMDFSEKIVIQDKTKTWDWKTADVEADGVTPIWVQLDKGDVKDLYDHSVDYGEQVYMTREGHKAQVTAMYNDTTKTAQDMLDYDYKTGWDFAI